MRLLSRQEQIFCDRMLLGADHTNFFSNIIDDDLGQCVIRIFKNQAPKVEIGFTNETAGEYSLELSADQTVEILRVSRVVVTIISLIQLLEKDNYIILNQTATSRNVTTFGPGRTDDLTKYVGFPLPDESVSDLIVKYLTKDIVVNDEFRRFCANGYIPRDEQRFRRQIRLAWAAFAVALLAAFTNLAFNIKREVFSDGTKIKQNQIDTIVTNIQSVKVSIDTMDARFARKLTIKKRD